MTGQNSNILWVDYAKFIGILLMIFGHIIAPSSHIYSFLYLFHMPLFFIVSGYLYKQKNVSDNFQRIFYGLFIPYIIYQFLYLPLTLYDHIIISNQDFVDTLIKCLYGILQGATISNAPYHIVCGPCWFIMVIMQLKLLLSLFKNNLKNIITLSIVAIIISKFLILHHILLQCCLNCTIIAIPYFLIGILLKKYNINFDKSNKYLTCSFIIFSIIVLNLLLSHNGLIKISRPLEPFFNPSPSIILMYLGGVIGTIMIILISNMFKTNKQFVNTISKNTLFIIFAQEFLLYFLKTFNILELINNMNCIFIKLILTTILSILILYCCYLFILTFSHKFPIIFGKYRPNKN